MADISKVVLPGSQTEYDIKDTAARTSASSAAATASSAYTLASAALPANTALTTAQVNQIWEEN